MTKHPLLHHAVVMLVALVILIIAQSSDFLLLVDWWSVTSKYGHSFVVFPLIAYLIYERRDDLLGIIPRTEPAMAIMLALMASALVVFRLINIEILSTTTCVLMIIATVWLVMGRSVVFTISIPLFLLFTTVPMWELFAPILTAITADVAYLFLKVTNVAVYREGTFLSIPEGTFEIADGCGGFRYFIVGLTLGLATAYLFFHKTSARIFTVFAAVVLSMLGNWVRVAIVIWAGHVTDMQHPYVDEHVNLGWWIFAALFFPYFLICGKLSADVKSISGSQIKVDGSLSNQKVNLSALSFSLFLVVLCVVMVPWYLTAAATQQDSIPNDAKIQPLGSIEGWNGPLSYSGSWAPHYRGAQEYVASYSREGKVVTVYIAYYTSQDQDQELVNFNHTLFNEHWRPYSDRSRVVGDGGAAVKMLTTQIATDVGEFDMFSWYYVAGFETADRRVAKLLEAAKIFSGNKVSAVVGILSGDAEIDIESDTRFMLDIHAQVVVALDGL